MKYSIVIPTYNHCDDLLKPCVESIIKHSNLADIELIIVANGCKDETQGYFTYLAHYFEVRGLLNNLKCHFDPSPLGYSKSTNIGIRLATTDKIVLLNNDTICLDQAKNQWLDMLNAPFDTKPNCGVSCVVKSHSEPAGHDFAIFFCVMIHRKVFDKIGLLNEEYGKGAGEDTEFCIEAERAGFTVDQCADTHTAQERLWSGIFPLYHLGEGTVHDKGLVPDWEDVFWQNSLKLSQKYNPAWAEAQLKLTQAMRATSAPTNKRAIDREKLQKQNPGLYHEMFTDNPYKFESADVDGKVVFDIGANAGFFSLLCAESGAREVIAVEANSGIFDVMLKNIEGYENIIKPIQAAVFSQGGLTVNFEDYDVRSRITSKGALTATTITLQSIVQDVPGDDLVLKMDIEGGEYDVLLNTPVDVLRKFKTVYLETHRNYNDNPLYQDPQMVRDRMVASGFKNLNISPMYIWWYDPQGKIVSHEEMGTYVEKWVRE